MVTTDTDGRINRRRWTRTSILEAAVDLATTAGLEGFSLSQLAHIIIDAYPQTSTLVSTKELGHRNMLNNSEIVDRITAFVTPQPATVS